MEWIDYNELKPKSSGSYVISLTRPLKSGGDYTFKYLAYYDTTKDSWFKFNPFDNENKVLEEITLKVNGSA